MTRSGQVPWPPLRQVRTIGAPGGSRLSDETPPLDAIMVHPIYSMTGFGAAQVDRDALSVRAEVRTVNHRHLQIRQRLPHSHHALEPQIEAIVKKALKRGAVQVHVHLESTTTRAAVQVDTALGGQYMQAYRELAESLKLAPDFDLKAIASLPGVLQSGEAPGDTNLEADCILEAVTKALEDLGAMRAREGEAMRADMRVYAKEILALHGAVEARSPVVVQEHKAKLSERVAALLTGEESVSEKDLAREIAVLSDRLDVSEELSRLAAHLEQLEVFLSNGGAVGRKLDFLAQEFMREANTIGSKCSDAETAHRVVDLKTAIERLREQVQNVE